MSKKPRFSIPNHVSRGLDEAISMVENNQGLYRNAVISLSRIDPDPYNPRKLEIGLSDLENLSELSSKNNELSKLNELAESIKLTGLINPIIVYKKNEKYQIVAGERRFWASHLAGRKEIEARVFHEKPTQYELKLLQWFENTEREDLSLIERIDNVNEIIISFKNENNGTIVTHKVLNEITGMSSSMASYYLSLIDAPDDVLTAIKEGKISSIEKASLIANTKDIEIRKLAIEACTNNISLQDLRKLLRENKKNKEHQMRMKSNDISLGKTTNLGVIKILIEAICYLPDFKEQKSFFDEVNWNNKRDVLLAFKKLVFLLENSKRV